MYQVQRQVCLALLKSGTSIAGVSKADERRGKMQLGRSLGPEFERFSMAPEEL